CCLGMEFLNTNVSVLTCISLHGDQLFEECVRYVKWTLRDGLDPVERIDGIDTEFEFADWHAKYTLYKLELICNHSSAGELDTTMANINCTGKTNAMKGVESHYNDYSGVHMRETEAHI
ncbi:hypothetical protein P5673_027767, partial [Acropora cervicornis]